MNEKIMNIVNAICNAQATDCKSSNKVELARQLLDIANVPSNASIQEIPLDWNQQVVVMFSVPNDNNYYSLFAGTGKDGLFHFELAIDGETTNGEFVWYEGTRELHIDYFKNGQSTNGQKEGNYMEITVIKGKLSASTIILEYHEIDSMAGWQLMENNKVGEVLTLAYNALMGIYVWTCECLRYTVQHLFTEYEIFLVSEVTA